MIYPNGRHMTRSPGIHFGPAPGLDVYARRRGDSMNCYLGETWQKSAGVPDGYGMLGLVPALRSGAMTALVQISGFGSTGALLAGGPVSGDGSFGAAVTGALSLIATVTGTATFGMTGNGGLAGVVQMTAIGSVTFGGSGALGMIVPFTGAGSWGVTGGLDLRGTLSMAGGWTPFTELSPEGLAASLWGAVAAEYDAPGTMGAKINMASSGGVDLDALAAAVMSSSVEPGVDVTEVLRVIAAALAGKVSGAAGPVVVFRDLTDSKDRITATVDAEGNRTSVLLDVD